MNKLPTQKELQEKFDYDPTTGELTYKTSHRPSLIGKPVRSLDKGGYYRVYVSPKTYYVHRIIYKWMTGNDPNFIDHINGCKTDNRWENLRSVSARHNQINIPAKGYYKEGNRYYARLAEKGKATILGSFECPLLAHLCYADEHKQRFGEFSPYFTT